MPVPDKLCISPNTSRNRAICRRSCSVDVQLELTFASRWRFILCLLNNDVSFDVIRISHKSLSEVRCASPEKDVILDFKSTEQAT
jgi:hypothetical protein